VMFGLVWPGPARHPVEKAVGYGFVRFVTSASMIRKSGARFSEKIMLHQKIRAPIVSV
jgi:hypothetical protein